MTNAITCSVAPTTTASTMAARTPRKTAHKCRSAIWLLLMILAATQHIAHARNIHDRIDDISFESTGLVETDPAADAIIDDANDDATNDDDNDDYFGWLEERLVREVETLRRTVRHIEQRKRHTKHSRDQAAARAPPSGQSAARAPLSDQQLDELYRSLSLPLFSLLRSQMVPAKRSSNNMSTSSSSTAAGNEKRPQVVSLCHFKLCTMGRKRSARSLASESRLIDRPAFET